jgi:1-phosphofructokinase
MIVTVTPNPSIDRTFTLPALHRGSVVRSETTWTEPSGKGVNVSLALRAHGHPTRAVLPAGGSDGRRLVDMLRATGVDQVAVPIADETRSNISLVEPDGTVTKINAPGPVLTQDELDALVHAVADSLPGTMWLAGCGSLPRGAPSDLYARLVAVARAAGTRTAIDSSGAAFAAALPAGPDLVKPNAHELAEATGLPVTTLGEAVDAAHLLQKRGARSVLASLGADGALLVEEPAAGAVDDEDVTHGEVLVEHPSSAVGAGDALLAGFLAGGGGGRDALAVALGWAGAAVERPGTLVDGQATAIAGRVVLHDHLDVDRKLRLD